MRRQSPAPGTHYASTNLRNALHHSSSNSVLYPVSTPLASLQKHQPGAAGGIIRHERTSNPPVQVSFVPRESADLDDDDSGDLSDDDLDQNNNDARHISTIKIGSSSEGLQKFAPMQPPKQFTSRIDAAAWGSDVDRVDHARKKGGYAVGGLRSGGFEKRHGTESRAAATVTSASVGFAPSSTFSSNAAKYGYDTPVAAVAAKYPRSATVPRPQPLPRRSSRVEAINHFVRPTSTTFAADYRKRHRKHEDDSMTAGARCCFGFLILIAQILLNGVMALCLYWVIQYRSSDKGETFAWKNNPDLEFNLHPVLMIAGFIYFMGQAMLMYRTCRCCRRIWNKLLHTVFHILSIPCIAIGFIAVLDSHNLRTVDGNPAPIPNFYSLHSWIGLAAMGLFALQFMVGFFSFLLLLCCESATASFRASLVPIHSTFGISTFVLAVAAACAGLTEKAFFSLSLAYNKWVPYLFDPTFNKSTALAGLNNVGPAYDEKYFEESLVINVMGAALILLAVVIPLIVSYPKFRYRPQRIVTVTHDRYG